MGHAGRVEALTQHPERPGRRGWARVQVQPRQLGVVVDLPSPVPHHEPRHDRRAQDRRREHDGFTHRAARHEVVLRDVDPHVGDRGAGRCDGAVRGDQEPPAGPAGEHPAGDLDRAGHLPAEVGEEGLVPPAAQDAAVAVEIAAAPGVAARVDGDVRQRGRVLVVAGAADDRGHAAGGLGDVALHRAAAHRSSSPNMVCGLRTSPSATTSRSRWRGLTFGLKSDSTQVRPTIQATV